jgi:hypothetical protein
VPHHLKEGGFFNLTLCGMEYFLRQLESKYKISLHHFLYGKNSYKTDFDILFKELLSQLHRSEIKIVNYINKDIRRKRMLFTCKNDKYRIDFIIYKDKTSEIKLSYTEKYNKTFDPSFITSKLNDLDYYVYFIKSDYGYKIGKTKNIKVRLKTFDVKLPFDIYLYAYIKTKQMDDCEKFFHNILSEKRINGEWFDLNEYDFLEIERLSKNWGEFNYN